jgi:hypothetical protein
MYPIFDTSFLRHVSIRFATAINAGDRAMARFMVRVELRENDNLEEPSGEDYTTLHLAMQRNSYFRIIKSSKGEWFHLPPAEYTVSWDATLEAVIKDLKPIVGAVWKPFSLFVTKANGMRFYGLEPASSEEVKELGKTDV